MTQEKNSLDWEEVVDGLVVVDEAAKRLGVKASILHNWRRRSADPDYVRLFYKKGKVVWFDLREFAQDVERQKELEYEKATQVSRQWGTKIKKGFTQEIMLVALLVIGIAICIWLEFQGG